MRQQVNDLKLNKFADIFLCIILFLLVHQVLSTASPLQWVKYKSFKYDSKNLPEGKTVAKYSSPDKSYELISRKENSHNNLLMIYLHKKNLYTFIDEYQAIQKVQWQADSSKVLFQAIKEIDQQQISYWKIRYFPEKNLLLAMILKMSL